MKTVKIHRRQLLPMFFLLLLCTCLLGMNAAAAEKTKNGLKKEGANYYYYEKGVKVTNTWKTVKKNTYYFGKDGAAYRCSSRPDKYYTSTQIITVKKVKGKKYGFTYKALLAKGVYADKNGKLYYFNKKTGVYDSKNTKKLRALAKKGSNAAALQKLIVKLDGKKGKRETFESCNPPGSLDVLYTFAHVTVDAHRSQKGKTDKLFADAVSPR